MGKVGILGGSFDPPHVAHVAMAEEAWARIPLDRVLYMPAPNPPHKTQLVLTPYELRVKMVELAIEGRRGLELSRMEEFRDGPSYTIDLLRHYMRLHNDEIFFIIGADTMNDLPSWLDPRGILELATIVVFPRTGFPSILPVEGDASVVLFEAPVIDVSSSEIRDKVAAGEPTKHFLPEPVHDFILEKSLYA